MKTAFLATTVLTVVGVIVSAMQTAEAAKAKPRPQPRPVAAAVDPWTGWYAGLSLGGAVERTCPQQNSAGGIPIAFNDNFLASLYTPCKSEAGVIGGAQVGYNKQFGNWVVGLEADFSGLSTRTSRSVTASTATRTVTENVNANTDMLATFRPKVGVLINPMTLVYVTGGMAMADVRTDSSTTQAAPPIPPGLGTFQAFGSNSKFVPGWTVGAGAEWKMGGGWSVKAEYLYVNLDPVQYYQTNRNQANVGLGVDNIVPNISVSTQLHIARLGLNYQFGDPSANRSLYASAGPVAYNWSGAYLGGTVGGDWGHSKSTEPSAPIDPAGGFWEAANHVIDSKTNGLISGAEAGYNWQSGAIVYGLEGDLGYMNFKGQQASDIFSGTTETATGGYYGMVRGRLGYSMDRVLVYGTGGLMVADVNAHVDYPTVITPGDMTITSTRTTTQAGWTAGGGLEYALFDGFSVKGEYLHFDLGSQRVIATSINGIGGPFNFAFDIKNSGDIVRFGFNKKFF
ncbi:MAG TPA: outer membrane beta-barrel protein [Xanthobacteraceae bacterium]|jgi:outer membrane immunogenic protein|nr:outer membrane beta-barrel protein [Xanthobacteraceae bacterium]